MLYHPTVEKLTELRLMGMHAGLVEQQDMSDIERLGFDERLGLLLDREATFRAERRLKYRLRNARLRQNAVIEDLDYRHPPRTGPGADGPSHHRAVDQKEAQPADHRADRRGKDMDRLRLGQQGLPRRLHRSVPPPLAAVR